MRDKKRNKEERNTAPEQTEGKDVCLGKSMSALSRFPDSPQSLSGSAAWSPPHNGSQPPFVAPMPPSHDLYGPPFQLLRGFPHPAPRRVVHTTHAVSYRSQLILIPVPPLSPQVGINARRSEEAKWIFNACRACVYACVQARELGILFGHERLAACARGQSQRIPDA